jgi:hypothetical protein
MATSAVPTIVLVNKSRFGGPPVPMIKPAATVSSTINVSRGFMSCR